MRGNWNGFTVRFILSKATNIRTQRSRVASWALAVFVAGSLPLASLVGRDARAQEKETPTLGTIERLDPRLDQIVPSDARVERIAEGFDWSEGPVWDRQRRLPALLRRAPEHGLQVAGGQGGQRLPQAQRLHRHDAPRRRAGLERPADRLPGPARSSASTATAGSPGWRPTATFTTLADRYKGKRFNSPNDGVFKSNGDLYFTDPPYGLLGLNDDPAKELDFNGVYRSRARTARSRC